MSKKFPVCEHHLGFSCVAQAAAEAQATARKGMLRGQPSDKRKLNQKGIQRIDSMQFGGVSPHKVMTGSFVALRNLCQYVVSSSNGEGVYGGRTGCCVLNNHLPLLCLLRGL